MYIYVYNSFLLIGNKYHLGGKAALRCTILQDDKLTSSLSFETVQNIPDEYQNIYASGMKVKKPLRYTCTCRCCLQPFSV